jgi:predicted DCC family thiol-disulfide oxidoreductase YuxK
MLYDAECPFCRWSAGMLVAWDRRETLIPLALQDPAAAELLPDLSPQQRMDTWHLITAEGKRYSGGLAFVPLFNLLPGGTPLSRLAARFPRLAVRLYAAVSDHRDKLVKLIPAPVKRWAARRMQRRAEALERSGRVDRHLAMREESRAFAAATDT